MPKGATFSRELLEMIFWNYPIVGLCDAAAAPDTLYVSLHVADPTSEGNQSSFEVHYTGYVRHGMSRNTATWDINGNTVSPKNPITFPEMTGGNGGLVSYWAVGTSLSGAGRILYIGTVSPSIGIGVGVEPEFDTTTIVTEV